LLSIDRGSITAEPAGALKMTDKNSVRENVEHAVIGAGAYYGLSWIFTWYPAFIYGLAICQQTDPSMAEYAELFGLIFMIVAYLFIQFMIMTKRYVAVAVIYVATLWPFLCILKHCWDFAGDNDTFPLPPVDFWPLW
jgi:hypothetical protein